MQARACLSIAAEERTVDTADVLSRFEDLTFPLEIEFGSLELSILGIVELKTGSVLRTSHSVRAPLTLRAGETPIAWVETQVSGEALSVRVQSILDPLGKPEDGAQTARPQAK
jgi:flagellar motor switch/type III secretory pathway protein FliN